jgi:hypothetical protein
MALLFANNNSLSAITAKPSGLSGGAMNLISTQTASSSATISFTSGIDDTYDEYVFKFYNIHPATDNTKLTFNGSIDSGSNYNVTKTTSAFYSYHAENDVGYGLGYYASEDLAQSTSFQPLIVASGNANDECGSGYLHLFNPSSTTFVKHFISRGNAYSGDYSQEVYIAGYANTTSAVNAVQFKMSSGNIDSGVIKLYGIS